MKKLLCGLLIFGVLSSCSTASQREPQQVVGNIGDKSNADDIKINFISPDSVKLKDNVSLMGMMYEYGTRTGENEREYSMTVTCLQFKSDNYKTDCRLTSYLKQDDETAQSITFVNPDSVKLEDNVSLMGMMYEHGTHTGENAREYSMTVTCVQFKSDKYKTHCSLSKHGSQTPQ